MHTLLCDLLGTTYPLIQAPIAGASCPELAAAVSNAGGLGMLSVTWRSLPEIRALLQQTRQLTDRPFGVNLVLEWEMQARLTLCLEEGVRIISLFWGDPTPYIPLAHQAGAIVLHTAGSVPEAREAVDAGADAVVVQGWEAGGHVRGQQTLFTLLPAVVEAVAPVPVVAAGGIVDGRGMVAALTLGAAGVWLGTRFVASQEARAHPLYQQRLLEASGEETVYTSLFNVGWENAPHRVLRNSVFTAWEAAGCPPPGSRPGEGEAVAYYADGDPVIRYSDQSPLPTITGDIDALAMYAGQGVGRIQELLPAAQIVQNIITEAESLCSR